MWTKVYLDCGQDIQAMTAPEYVANNLEGYRAKFFSWMYTDSPENPYRISQIDAETGEEHKVRAYGGEAVVHWLNEFVIHKGEAKAVLLDKAYTWDEAQAIRADSSAVKWFY